MPSRHVLSSEYFQEVADFAPVMLWRITADFRCDWVNRAWLEFTGERLEDQVGFAWLDRLHPDDAEATAERFDIAFSERMPATAEFRLRRHDNIYRWFRDTGVPFYREAIFSGFVGSCVDITDLKEAQSNLAELRFGMPDPSRTIA